MARVLIGALSANDYGNRREACREAWLNSRRVTGAVDAVFLIGAANGLHAPVRVTDRLFLPCQDDYLHLPCKTRWFCRWAVQFKSWDWLFKCDDDTFIHIPRLTAFLDGLSPGADYVGCEPGGRWVGYASGGAGYALSRKAAELVAGQFKACRGAEDLLVGRFLARNGIELLQSRRFVPWTTMDNRPRPDNDLITGHKMPRDVWDACVWDFS